MWWILAVAALLLVVWGIFSTHRLLYPPAYPIPIPNPLPPYTQHALTGADDAVFDLWLLRPDAPRAFVLICHGYYANRFQVLDLAEGLRRRGFAVGLIELRGHGSRRGPCTLGVKESDDAVRVLQWAQTALPGSLPSAVIGFSMGAAVACQAAAKAGDVRAVVVDSIYSRLLPVIKKSLWRTYHLPAIPWAWVTWWCLQAALRARLDPRDPAVLASRMHQPLLAIQGGEDRRVVPLLGREFFQRWAGPKERWFEPAVVHVGMFAKHPEAYCNRVAAFLEAALT